MARSGLLKICALAVAMGARAGSAWAQSVTIGVLTELGGPYADLSGQGAVEATRMAAQDLMPPLGTRRVEILSADKQGKADIGTGIFRSLADGRCSFVVQ